MCGPLAHANPFSFLTHTLLHLLLPLLLSLLLPYMHSAQINKVLLDEPSAGLDPKSRRNLWDVILRTMSHRAVVLTTHSLEEAEALCGRIAIMVKGQIRVLGTKQRLKSEFGAGFSITCKIKHIANNNSDENTSAAELMNHKVQRITRTTFF